MHMKCNINKNVSMTSLLGNLNSCKLTIESLLLNVAKETSLQSCFESKPSMMMRVISSTNLFSEKTQALFWLCNQACLQRILPKLKQYF